jgi:2-polyprenyl-3-methyl-5-hydroxy-6-metoxy-1,4-benzoquinol methylase
MLSTLETELAIRLILGRHPESEAELHRLQRHASLAELRAELLRSAEARGLVAEEGAVPRQEYRAPLFLLQPPPAGIPWRFLPPELDDPVSQLATNDQIGSATHMRWCAQLQLTPKPHRKQWEFIWIVAVLNKAGVLRAGSRVLGFGCGRELLPSYFASLGMDVLATDAPSEVVAQSWGRGTQHASSGEDLRRPQLVSADVFARHVRFRHVDMNAVPGDLRGFDACWSACALEHLGSLQHGLDFMENSLACLRDGGVAVHTTEFNLSSNTDTFESGVTSVYRKQDIERLLVRLAAQGHEVWPLNLHPGATEVDEVIDLPPYSLPHLKLMLRRYVSTSVGIVVRKRGGGGTPS